MVNLSVCTGKMKIHISTPMHSFTILTLGRVDALRSPSSEESNDLVLVPGAPGNRNMIFLLLFHSILVASQCAFQFYYIKSTTSWDLDGTEVIRALTWYAIGIVGIQVSYVVIQTPQELALVINSIDVLLRSLPYTKSDSQKVHGH